MHNAGRSGDSDTRWRTARRRHDNSAVLVVNGATQALTRPIPAVTGGGAGRGTDLRGASDAMGTRHQAWGGGARLRRFYIEL